jgi:hypothetical protein
MPFVANRVGRGGGVGAVGWVGGGGGRRVMEIKARL